MRLARRVGRLAASPIVTSPSAIVRVCAVPLAVLFFCRLAGIGQTWIPALAILLAAIAVAHGVELMLGPDVRSWLWRLPLTHWFAIVVLGLMAVACAVRLTGLNTELGHVPLDVDENRLAASIQHYFVSGELLHDTVETHPGIAFWLFAGATFVSYLQRLASGVIVSPYHLSNELIVAACRVANVFVGAAIIAIAAWVARRVAGPRAGILTALLVTIAPLSIQSTTECRCDPMMVLGVLIAVQLSLAVEDHRNLRWVAAAGAVAGVAAGVKYSGAFAILPVLLSVLWLPARERFAGVLCAIFAFGAAVAVTNHFVWSDVPTFLRQLHDQVFITGAGHWAATDNPRAFYVEILGRFGVGTAFLLLAAAFGVYTLTTRRVSLWIVCSFPIVYMAFMTGRPSQLPRWVFPLLPFVTIAGSAAIALAAARIVGGREMRAGRRRLDRSAFAAVLVVCLAQPLWFGAVEVSHRLATPTHALAEQWMKDHAKHGEIVTVEDRWLDLSDAPFDVKRVRDLRATMNGGLDALNGSDWVIVPEPNFGHPLLRQLGFAGRIHAEQKFGAPNGYDYEFFRVPKR